MLTTTATTPRHCQLEVGYYTRAGIGKGCRAAANRHGLGPEVADNEYTGLRVTLTAATTWEGWNYEIA